MIPKLLLPSLPSPFLFYCRYGALHCSHWSMIRVIFSLHHVQVEIQWSPCFTYAHSRFFQSCSGPPAPLFWSLLVMVSLVYDLWYVEEYYSIIYLYQVETYLSIKNSVFSFTKKAYFITVWGKIDESECYKKYARLGECLKRFYIFSDILFIYFIIHVYIINQFDMN